MGPKHATAGGILGRNRVFAWLALATCCLLLVPLVAMQFTSSVDWGVGDFAVMGVLLFAAGSVFVLVARRISPRYRPVAGVLVALGFLYVWAELAVGVFTSLGS